MSCHAWWLTRGALISSFAIGAPAAVGGAEPAAAFPACYTRSAVGAGRFEDQRYYGLMAADGLRSSPPQALFARSTAAAKSGELYKALFFARLLTKAAPDRPAVWTNAAAIADQLSLSKEAAGYRAHAIGAAAGSLVSELLPGAPIPRRPKTLSDWAAAVSLMSDNLAAIDGPQALASLKDAVSGMQVNHGPSQISGRGVVQWAEPVPIRLDDVLPNVFALRDARAMAQRGVGWGNILLATYATASAAAGAAFAGTNPYYNPAANANLSAASGEAVAQAFAQTGRWKDGSYTIRRYTDGHAAEQRLTPRPAGEFEAIDLPVPVLLASGDALSGTQIVRMTDKSGGPARMLARRISSDGAAAKPKASTVAAMSYPRLATLRQRVQASENVQRYGSVYGDTAVTVLELLLSPEDIAALAPGASAAITSSLPALGAAASAYERGDETLVFNVQNGLLRDSNDGVEGNLIGWDARGVCYAVSVTPGAWAVPALGGTLTAVKGAGGSAAKRGAIGGLIGGGSVALLAVAAGGGGGTDSTTGTAPSTSTASAPAAPQVLLQTTFSGLSRSRSILFPITVSSPGTITFTAQYNIPIFVLLYLTAPSCNTTGAIAGNCQVLASASSASGASAAGLTAPVTPGQYKVAVLNDDDGPSISGTVQVVFQPR
jgi:hypothetical protein